MTMQTGNTTGNTTSGVGGSLYGEQSSRGDLPSVLRSVFKQENIDYENDFYWLGKCGVV